MHLRELWKLIWLIGLATGNFGLCGAQEDVPRGAQYVRIASDVEGHIHPAACVTKKGIVLVIFSQHNYRDLKITRSADGGRTWSEPAPYGPTEKLTIYPGSLTTLSDGRIVHVWNLWYPDKDLAAGKSRHPQYAISSDDGLTWSATHSMPKNPARESVIRHPMLELGPDRWLCSLRDKTYIFDARKESTAPFGDNRVHGLVPIVRTLRGTLINGNGLRSTDEGKTWQKVAPFPDMGTDGWRFDLTVLDNSWLVSSVVIGEGFGGNLWRFVVSRDDGLTWDFDESLVLYDPGRPIGGRACPRTVQLDKETIGTVFYDTDPSQPGGSGVFFLRTPIASLVGRPK